MIDEKALEAAQSAYTASMFSENEDDWRPSACLRAAIEAYERALWKPMETAPKDGEPIEVYTNDFGVVQAYWKADEPNFWKNMEGSASYDPENGMGEWVSDWVIGNPPDHRLFCGATPIAWRPISLPPHTEEGGDDE